MTDCVFCGIVAGKIPARRVLENDDVIAFHDLNPAAPVHVLVIPRRHIATLDDAGVEDTNLLGKMLTAARDAQLRKARLIYSSWDLDASAERSSRNGREPE